MMMITSSVKNEKSGSLEQPFLVTNYYKIMKKKL